MRAKYRVTQTGPEHFIIEQKFFLIGWRDVSTPPFPYVSSRRPLKSVDDAKECIAQWEADEAKYPIHHYL